MIALARPFLQRLAVGGDRLLQPRRPALASPQCRKRGAEVVLIEADRVGAGCEPQRSSANANRRDQVNVATALISEFIEPVAVGDQRVTACAGLIAMKRFRHSQDGFGRRLTIVGRERDVAFEAKEDPDTFGMGGAAVLLPP
jgi:hypothetical protein